MLVYNTVLDAANQPVANQVVRVELSATAWDTSASSEVLMYGEVITDANGRYQIDLRPNSTLTPSNTYYTIREPNGTVNNIIVPNTGGPYWVEAILNPPLTGVWPSSTIINVQDANFTLLDNVDPTKQAKFELANIATATTRTFTLPNLSGNLVVDDSIVSSRLLQPKSYTNEAAANTAGANVATNIVWLTNPTGSGYTAGLYIYNGSTWLPFGGQGWTNYTPTITNMTLGNGSITARYFMNGKSVTYQGILVAGTTTSYTTSAVTFSLPVTSIAGYNQCVGQGQLWTGTNLLNAILQPTTTSTLGINTPVTASAANYGAFSSNVQNTGTTGNFSWSITYPAA